MRNLICSWLYYVKFIINLLLLTEVLKTPSQNKFRDKLCLNYKNKLSSKINHVKKTCIIFYFLKKKIFLLV